MPDIAIKESRAQARRLRRSGQYRAVQARGRRHAGRFFVLVAAAAEGGTRVGWTVSRHWGGAVARNRIKRRLRAIVRRNWAALPASGWHVVIHPRREAAAAPFTVLEAEWRLVTERLRSSPPVPRQGRPC